jgi:1-phosphofructokinase
MAATVSVFGPSTIVTVTIERAPDETDDVHFHAGGQGLWIARLLHRSGVPTVLCSLFGGESGDVARALAGSEGITVEAVNSNSVTGAYVHDRRSGERNAIAEHEPGAIGRHELDSLYDLVLTTSLDAGICVFAGSDPPDLVGRDVYRRLARDLRSNGVEVLCDLSGDQLRGALQGGVDFCKTSDADLRRDGFTSGDESPATLLTVLAGADNAAITRAEAPTIASLSGRAVVVTAPTFEPADHRGAGDAFTAAVAACRARGEDWADALRWAAAAGGLTATRRGLATAEEPDIRRLLGHVEIADLPADRGRAATR